MKQGFIILFFFCAWSSFGQNVSASSDKRVMTPPLVVESVDAGNVEVILSDAVPVTGQKYETSQRHTLQLVPVADASGKVVDAASEGIPVMSETAVPLPASASSVPQSDKLILIPVNTQKP